MPKYTVYYWAVATKHITADNVPDATDLAYELVPYLGPYELDEVEVIPQEEEASSGVRSSYPGEGRR